MNLLFTGSIPLYIFHAEKYWKGEASPNPFWEILMKPPINILEKVDYLQVENLESAITYSSEYLAFACSQTLSHFRRSCKTNLTS